MLSSPGNIFNIRRDNAIQFLRVSHDFKICREKSRSRGFFVFGDKQSFMEAYCISSEPKMLLDFDFSQFYLVSIHQGLCPTGGYKICVKNLRRYRDKVEITVSFKEPAPNEIVTLAMTTPTVFLMVSRTIGEPQPPVFRLLCADGTLLAERVPESRK